MNWNLQVSQSFKLFLSHACGKMKAVFHDSVCGIVVPVLHLEQFSWWLLCLCRELRWLHFHFSLSCIGEGNGNPFQCSCLENLRDGGAWWAAVYGVAQSRTRLKKLSSSSSSSRELRKSIWWNTQLQVNWSENAYRSCQGYQLAFDMLILSKQKFS